ncbi:MAG: GRRM system radical SAM/SPASM domain protein [Armatimonadetes bacterium]|nr:GRRM system radical SAM/SPASM domain protein [Armatimonadota bacterium]
MQPTPYCNIACDYCYLPNRDDRRVMAPAVLDAIGARLLAHPLVARDCTVVWHAGEPLVLAADWYREAMDRLEAAAGRPFVHAFQTNGVGLGEAWVRLARERALRIGLSLDGPAHLHDARRRTRNGRGTHAMVMKTVKRLQEAVVPFHVITVLTRDHLDQPDALFDFYMAHDLCDVGFNIEEIEGANTRSTLLDADLEDAFRLFFRRFLVRVERAGGAFRLREAIDAEGMLLHAPPGVLSEQARPLGIVSVDVAGRVSSFSPELLGQASPAHGDFTFGSLLEDEFSTIAARIESSRLAAEIARGVQACRQTCAYHAFCGGGAPANKWAEHGRFDVAETRFCRLGRQVVLEETLAMLEARLACSGAPPMPARAA